MASVGRKLIPFTLLQLRGTARTDRHGTGGEKSPPGESQAATARRTKFPKPPKGALGPAGLKEWRNVRKLMEAAGTIQAIDHATLFGYCALYELAVDDAKTMTAAQWTQLRMFAAELGFTPTSRERLRRPISG